MEAKFTVRNYRCFDFKNPMILHLESGKAIAFTGVNNVGKSVPLKFFWELRSLFKHLSARDSWGSMVSNHSFGMSFHGVKDDIEVFNNSNHGNIMLEIELFNRETENHLKRLEIEICRPEENQSPVFKFNVIAGSNLRDIKSFNNISNKKDNCTIFGKISGESPEYPILNYSQIIHLTNLLTNSLYVGAFRNAINNTNVPYFDLKVGTDFIKQWADWQNGFNRNHQNKILTLIEELSDLLNLERLSIQASVDYSTLNVIYSNKVYRLEELGSGIAQVIIILGNILLKTPGIVLIDEPEMNLHPQLQVRFLSLIEKYTNFLIYSTHSIGLAKSFSEKVFFLKKDNSSVLQISVDSPNSGLEFAGELFYGALSQIGCDKILLVEGQTELKIIQHFLRELGCGNEFLILPLYGRNQIHSTSYDFLEELTKLNLQMFSVIDSEKKNEFEAIHPNRQKFIENCTSLNINCKVLNRRAIENYLSDKAIKEVLGDNYRSLQPFESLADLENRSWQKSFNWKIASNMSFKDIENNDLGEFLKKICSASKPK